MSLDQTFAALSDQTRRSIIDRLANGELPLSDVAEPYDMSLTAVSKHVRILSDAGLISVTKRGRTRFCKLEGTPMKEAATWLQDYQRFWENQFESLARFLEEETR